MALGLRPTLRRAAVAALIVVMLSSSKPRPVAAALTPEDGSAAPSARSCAAGGGGAACPMQPFGEGLLVVRGAVPATDIALTLAAESAAWDDPLLTERGLVNSTRRIAGSAAQQSVTWLHRHRAHALGAIERAEAVALGAQRRAGWALTSTEKLGALRVRCVESIRYEVIGEDGAAPGEKMDGQREGEGLDAGWHQDEWSVLTVVITLSVTPDLRGGELELDRGAGPARAEGLAPGDVLVFRSWDAHRSRPVLRGGRHILVVEFWQGPTTTPDAAEGRPVELASGRAQLCPPALAADPASAALLWFCSKSADTNASQLLAKAARMVSGSAFLYEMAAAAMAIPLLDELSTGRAGASPSLTRIATALQRAAELRTAALVPSASARVPEEWDEEEDGAWQAPLVDGGDGASIGGFFRRLSRAKPCGFPAEGLRLLRRMMASRSIGEAGLREAVANHPVLLEAWASEDEYVIAARRGLRRQQPRQRQPQRARVAKTVSGRL